MTDYDWLINFHNRSKIDIEVNEHHLQTEIGSNWNNLSSITQDIEKMSLKFYFYNQEDFLIKLCGYDQHRTQKNVGNNIFISYIK